MSELKVNTISEVTGANGVVIDSTKLKDGGVIIADAGNIGSASDTDALSISSGGVVTFTQKPVINSGVAIDNITIDGTEIDLSSGDLTLDVAGDIILDADGGDVKINDGGTAIAELTNSSTDFVIKSVTNDKDLIFKGVDNSSAITALTLDMSDAGTAIFNHDIRVADGGQIGSASDADAMTIASGGAVTFTQTPVFPDGSLALADLDIDGGTDIGAAIVDADLFIVDDGAGGTNRKTTASRLKTYIGTGNTPSFFGRGSGATTVVNNSLTRIAARDEIFDNGGCYNNTGSNTTLNSLTAPADSFTPNVAGLYYFVGAIQLNTGNYNVGLVNNIGGTGGSETYVSLVYRKSDTANGMVIVAGYSLMNGTGNNVCLAAHQESGGNLNTNDSFYTTYFGGFLVKAS